MTMANQSTPADIVAELRAAGTDLSERRRSGVSRGPISDLAPTPEMRSIAIAGTGALRLGASISVATIATDKLVIAGYPGLAAAAGGLATPQIRHLATLGGNLAQRSRCWYYRNPHIACLKKGGTTCPARAGNHLYGVAFDLGPCVAPHPSTMAMALLAYGARVATDRRTDLDLAELLGDGSDGSSDNALAPGEIITAVSLPPSLANECAVYKRAISRTHAEWPLVEILARVVVANGTFQFAALTVGGIAPVPLRLAASEAALKGAMVTPAAIAEAARQSCTGAKPLPMTAYKLDLMRGLVQDVLEQCTALK
jgi:xanthine dehydrogenase YagS FAD-binding subunit